MSETEIQLLIESTKISKAVKEKLLFFSIEQNKEFKSLEIDILKLKSEYK